MKYRIKKDKRQEALDLMLERKVVQKPGRVKMLVYEQKPMNLGQWTKYFSMDEMDYFLEKFDNFDDVEGVKQNPICCICGCVCENEWGNNPYPIKDEGVCCDVCNATQVIPARMKELGTKQVEETPVVEPTQEEIEDYYGI